VILVGDVIVFGAPRAVVGVPGVVESVSPTVRLGSAVELLWEHRKDAVLARQGQFQLERDERGLRLGYEIARGQEAAWRSRVRRRIGCSFGWRPHRDGAVYRWYAAETPARREIVSAELFEVSLTPHPAYRGTWAHLLDGDLERRWRHLKLQARCWPKPRAVESRAAAADLVIDAPPPTLVRVLLDAFDGLAGVEETIANEYQTVLAAHRRHPHARTIEVRYPRSLRSAEAATARHAAKLLGEGKK